MDEKLRQGIEAKVRERIKSIFGDDLTFSESYRETVRATSNLVEEQFKKAPVPTFWKDLASKNDEISRLNVILDSTKAENEKLSMIANARGEREDKLRAELNFYDKKYQGWSDTADILQGKVQRLKRELSDRIGEAVCPSCKSLIRFKLKKK